MWVLSKRWGMISAPLFAPGVIILVIGIFNPGARTDDGMSFRAFGILWIALILLIHAGLFGYLYFQKRRAVYFAQNGIPATATILSAETTGTEINNMPQVELGLEIAIPGEAPYAVSHTGCWSPLSMPALQRGARLKVLVDPRNRKKIMFADDM